MDRISQSPADSPPATPAGPVSVQLDYGRGRPARRIRRHHLVVVALLSVCVVASWWMGRSVRDQTQTLLYQRQAARHVEPANLIVFESNARAAQAMIDAGTHVSLSADGPVPAVIREPQMLRLLRETRGASFETLGALVFLHELTTPSGARRIVAVQFLPHYLDGRSLPGAGLVAHVFEPGGLLGGPRFLGRSHARLLIPADGPDAADLLPPLEAAGFAAPSRTCLTVAGLDDLRWYAGQPDHLDSTHFTIDYVLDGVRGTIDGYLSDDGRHVRMHTRPAYSYGGTAHGLTQIAWRAGTLR